MVDWSYYDKPDFEMINAKYLPAQGEGKNMATQAVTAVNKLVYKWYNDGDVFDNTRYLTGWVNDLSSYANWLRENLGLANILDGVWECYTGSDYEDLLVDLADYVLDGERLEELAKRPATGSIYNCPGVYKFELAEDDEEY